AGARGGARGLAAARGGARGFAGASARLVRRARAAPFRRGREAGIVPGGELHVDGEERRGERGRREPGDETPDAAGGAAAGARLRMAISFCRARALPSRCPGPCPGPRRGGALWSGCTVTPITSSDSMLRSVGRAARSRLERP